MKQEYTIQFLAGPLKGKSFRIVGPSVKIGRGKTNHIVIDDKNLSREHIELKIDQRGLVVVDLESTNGIYCNENRIKEIVLSDGEKIRLGESVFSLSNGKSVVEKGSVEQLTMSSKVSHGLGSIIQNQSAVQGATGFESDGKKKFSIQLNPANRKRIIMYGGMAILLIYALITQSDQVQDPSFSGGEQVGASATDLDLGMLKSMEVPHVSSTEEDTEYGKAIVAFDTGKLNNALAIIEALVRSFPSNSLYKLKRSEWLQVRHQQATEIFRQGKLMMEGRYLEAALNSFRRVLQLIPDDRDPMHRQAKIAIAQIEQIRNR